MDRVVAAPLDGLADTLEGFSWDYDKASQAGPPEGPPPFGTEPAFPCCRVTLTIGSPS